MSRRSATRSLAVLTLFGWLALATSVAGCAGRSSPSPPSGGPDDAPPSSPSKAYGRAFLTEALRTYRFVLDPDVNGPVQRAGERLLRAIDADQAAVHFFVVDEPQPNAFAIPGGYIFVFTGLLSKLSTEDELAGVLAHELGHVTRDHFFQDRKQILALNLATLAALLLSGGHPAALAFPLGASYHLQLAYSREHESEADASAVAYLRQAGYDPSALARFFRALEVYERFNPPMVPAYFTTHPGVAERLRIVETMASAAPPPARVLPTADWGRVRASLATVTDGGGPREQYLLGVDHLKHDRIAPAIAAFRAVLAKDPAHARARADLALSLLKAHLLDQAQAEATRSSADDPNLAVPSIVLGILAQESGDHHKALIHFETAIKREPFDATTHLRLARSLAALGETSRETWHLARHHQLNLDPTGAAVHYERLLAPGTDPELRREAERALVLLRREGI